MNLLQNLQSEDLLNKTIFIRVDFNVPLELKTPGRFFVTDDERIRRFLDTSFTRIHELTNGNCRIIIGSHLGRPHKQEDHSNWNGIFNLQFVCAHFETLLKRKYEDFYSVFPPEAVDSQFQHSIEIIKNNQLPLGGIKFLPNLRYLMERESSYREQVIEDLSDVCDVYINCAFGTSHRESRSIITLPQSMKKKGKIFVAGMLLAEEISQLGKLAARVLKHPEQSVFIAGGSKVSDKIGIIKQFVHSGISRILLGGKMVNTFLLARSNKKTLPLKLRPDEKEEKGFRKEIGLAREIMELAAKRKVEVVFPLDYQVARDFGSSESWVSENPDFDKELQLDIGKKTIRKYSEILSGKDVKNIFWNGPLGAFDHPSNSGYSQGSLKIAESLLFKSLRNQDALAVVGGGDSAAIFQKFHSTTIMKGFSKELNQMIPGNINHKLFQIKFPEIDLYTLVNYFAKNFFISTGGGASLQFLEAYLKDKGSQALGSYLPGTNVLLD